MSCLAPRFGGPVQVVRSMARYQVLAGHEATICTTNADFPSGKLDKPTDRPVIEDCVATRYFPVQFAPLFFSSDLAAWLDMSIGDYDILHVHGLYRFPVTYAARCARRRRIPYLIRPQGALDPFLYQRSTRSLALKRLYERIFDVPNLNRASAIHYTAKDEAEKASFLRLEAPTFIAPNGLDWPMYAELPPRGSFRAKLGVPLDRPLAVFLGRINFKKGLDLLIPAFADALKSCPDALLAVVGPDNEGYGKKVRQWCREAGVQDKVMFRDQVPQSEVREVFVDADVFVLPSYTENFGMAVVEAMACGCPVVISDRVNICRDIQPSGSVSLTGLDVHEIADAIVKVLRDPDSAREMGRAGRKLVQEKYTWEAIVETLSVKYREIIEKDRS